MKRTFTYTLLLACVLTSMRCTEGTSIPDVDDMDNLNYTSYWYYNYEALQTVNHETLGLEQAADFNPYAVAQRGDTLFVANLAAGNKIGRAHV